MSADSVRDALQSACSSGLTEKHTLGGSRRLHSPERVHAVISTFIRDLPEDMTVMELRQSLEDIFHEL